MRSSEHLMPQDNMMPITMVLPKKHKNWLKNEAMRMNQQGSITIIKEARQPNNPTKMGLQLWALITNEYLHYSKRKHAEAQTKYRAKQKEKI